MKASFLRNHGSWTLLALAAGAAFTGGVVDPLMRGSSNAASVQQQPLSSSDSGKGLSGRRKPVGAAGAARQRLHEFASNPLLQPGDEESVADLVSALDLTQPGDAALLNSVPGYFLRTALWKEWLALHCRDYPLERLLEIAATARGVSDEFMGPIYERMRDEGVDPQNTRGRMGANLRRDFQEYAVSKSSSLAESLGQAAPTFREAAELIPKYAGSHPGAQALVEISDYLRSVDFDGPTLLSKSAAEVWNKTEPAQRQALMDELASQTTEDRDLILTGFAKGVQMDADIPTLVDVLARISSADAQKEVIPSRSDFTSCFPEMTSPQIESERQAVLREIVSRGDVPALRELRKFLEQR